MDPYSVDAYCRMMMDDNRVGPYTRALERAVKPGSIVFDIGAGPGLMSMIACRAGAARVYAIDPSSTLSIATAEAEVRGFGDRLIAIPQLSTAFVPEEQADVIVFDLRGVVPIYPGNVSSALDAARRLLAPAGTLIPRRDTLFGAVVESVTDYKNFVDPWVEEAGTPWRSAVAANANNAYRVSLSESAMLSDPVAWHTIEYGITVSESAAGTIEGSVRRAGTAHGLALWFQTDLYDDIGFSTAPGVCGAIYGQLLLPFAQPVAVAEGDVFDCRIRADSTLDDVLWSWSGQIVRNDHILANINHSTFNGFAIRKDLLKQVIMTESRHVDASLTFDPNGRYVKTEKVLSCEVSGETVLLSLNDSNYFGLNAVGTVVWQELTAGTDLDAICASVCATFDVDEATCRRDVAALLTTLADMSLIHKVPPAE